MKTDFIDLDLKKVNVKAMELWHAALVSGNYTQTTKTLRDKSGMCCLGVLCDVYRKHNKKGKWENNKFFGSSNTAPLKVSNWAGFSDGNPCVDVEEESFASLNDDYNYSFKQIAQVVQTLIRRAKKAQGLV